MKFLTDKKLNEIRGKAMVGHATPEEILSVLISTLNARNNKGE